MDTLIELLLGNTLTRLTFFPAVAALPLLFFPRGSRERGDWKATKTYVLAVSLVELALGVYYAATHLEGGVFAFARDPGLPLAWIERFGASYDMVSDGISMPLALLTVLLLPLVVLGSWRGITFHWRSFGAALLVLTTGILGTLFAFDLLVFYVFWEIVLVPMYLIIGIWGGEERIVAAIKFFLYTLVGSLLMLVGILWLGWTHFQVAGEWSFSYEALLALDLPLAAQLWLFAAFGLAFLIKVPVFPVHTWLPAAHVQAPTGGSVLLAGVLLKLGTYGLLRFGLPLFPDAAEASRWLLVLLALIGILYGALVAWVQEDMKKLVAYSSIAHLGFVVLGLAAADILAWEGALLQMVNHGLSTGALFLLVGMLYDRRHTKRFADFGGLAAVVPVFAFFLVFSSLASVGLPGLNGFVGELFILVGSFRALGWPAVVATFGVVLAAVYLFKMLHETLWGPLDVEENRGMKDLDARELASLIPLAVLMLAIGVVPEVFLAPSRPALERTLAAYQERLGGPPPAEATLAPRSVSGLGTAVAATGEAPGAGEEISEEDAEAGRGEEPGPGTAQEPVTTDPFGRPLPGVAPEPREEEAPAPPPPAEPVEGPEEAPPSPPGPPPPAGPPPTEEPPPPPADTAPPEEAAAPPPEAPAPPESDTAPPAEPEPEDEPPQEPPPPTGEDEPPGEPVETEPEPEDEPPPPARSAGRAADPVPARTLDPVPARAAAKPVDPVARVAPVEVPR